MLTPSAMALAALCVVAPARLAAQSSSACAGTEKNPAPAAAALPQQAQPASTPAWYRSAWDGYRPYAEQAVGNWREANDTAGRIGGWKAYAREGQGGGVQTACGNDASPSSSAGHVGLQAPPAAGPAATGAPSSVQPAR